MKTLKLFLVALVALFSVTSFSQTTHTFTVTPDMLTPGTYTVADTTVEVGDVVEFVNGYTTSQWNVEIDGVSQPGYNPTPSTYSVGQTIYSYTFQSGDVGNMDILVYSGSSQFRFQYVGFTVVEPSTTGVFENQDIKFSVYPNPTTDFLNISGDNVESVKIFDMNGRLVLSDTFTSKVDVSSLVNGYYTLFVNDTKPIRFIKQ